MQEKNLISLSTLSMQKGTQFLLSLKLCTFFDLNKNVGIEN